MGNLLSRIFPKTIYPDYLTRGSQTEHLVFKRNVRTQTDLKFTERLKDFKIDLDEVNSMETFDNTCEVCEANMEREAVGYCGICEQFLCLKCCEYHENVTACRNHKLVSKDEFHKVIRQKPLYEHNLVPHKTYSIIDTPTRNLSFTASMNIPETEDTVFLTLDNDTNGCFVCSIDNERESLNKDYISCIFNDNVSNNPDENSCLNVFPKCAHTAFFISENKVYRYCYVHNKNCATIAYKTSGNCYSVAPFNKGLAISVHMVTGYTSPNWQIQHVDYRGKVHKHISYNADGQPLFNKVKHLTSNTTEDILFASDNGNNCVVAINIQGNVIFKFSHDLIQSPRGLTCDEEANIYVICGNGIIQIHKSGDRCRQILNLKDTSIGTFFDNIILSLKGNFIVSDICYNPVSKHLLVTENRECPKVTVFKIIP